MQIKQDFLVAGTGLEPVSASQRIKVQRVFFK